MFDKKGKKELSEEEMSKASGGGDVQGFLEDPPSRTCPPNDDGGVDDQKSGRPGMGSDRSVDSRDGGFVID